MTAAPAVSPARAWWRDGRAGARRPVVGGGVVGAGAALDAATRGLTVGLVEARDFASGTSSRSSKLIHGGLRYLEQLDFGLVREALQERALLLDTLAPHLVQPVPFLYPLQHRGWERPTSAPGVALYDTLGASGRARRRSQPPPPHPAQAPGASPRRCKRDALTGAIQYYDAQVDDARHTHDHRPHGRGLRRARARRARGSSGCCARASGSSARGSHDLEIGRRVRRARPGRSSTPPACGPTRSRRWPASAASSTSGRPRASTSSCPATGSSSRPGSSCAPRSRCCSSSRGAGTGSSARPTPTGTLDQAHPAASRRRHRLPARPRQRRARDRRSPSDDVEGVYAGLRPLLSGESETTRKLSREHAVAHPVPGLVVVAGGKYTTYRVMAKDAVDAAARRPGRAVPPSVTDDVPLLGAEGYHALWNARAQLAARSRPARGADRAPARAATGR